MPMQLLCVTPYKSVEVELATAYRVHYKIHMTVRNGVATPMGSGWLTTGSPSQGSICMHGRSGITTVITKPSHRLNITLCFGREMRHGRKLPIEGVVQ